MTFTLEVSWAVLRVEVVDVNRGEAKGTREQMAAVAELDFFAPFNLNGTRNRLKLLAQDIKDLDLID